MFYSLYIKSLSVYFDINLHDINDIINENGYNINVIYIILLFRFHLLLSLIINNNKIIIYINILINILI